MTTPVNFEIAKLLKEKGFAERCRAHWYENNIQGKISSGITYPQTDFNKWYRGEILAPTISEVVMWLYEKHGIWISVDKQNRKKFKYRISDINLQNDAFTDLIGKEGFNYDSPTEAYEAAIEYCLTKLI